MVKAAFYVSHNAILLHVEYLRLQRPLHLLIQDVGEVGALGLTAVLGLVVARTASLDTHALAADLRNGYGLLDEYSVNCPHESWM